MFPLGSIMYEGMGLAFNQTLIQPLYVPSLRMFKSGSNLIELQMQKVEFFIPFKIQ